MSIFLTSIFLCLICCSIAKSLVIDPIGVSTSRNNCNSNYRYTTCAQCTTCAFTWRTSTNSCTTSLNLLGFLNNDQVTQAYDCPVPLPEQNNIETEYSDDFTRNKIAPMVAAAYSNTDEDILGCLNNHFTNPLTFYKRYIVSCPGINEYCSGYIAIDEAEKLILLSFRGSKVTQYLIENVDFITFDKVSFPLGGNILNYWSDAFFNIWNSGLEDDLKNLLPNYQDQEFKLWIAGHSLGGVLAALSSMYIIKNGLYSANLTKYMSFGEPRIGDQVFAQIFDEIVPYKCRVIHRHDPVPHQPYRLPTQTGNDSFWHHHFEVWYPTDMCPGANFTICHRAEDPICSNSAENIDPTAKDHDYYFGVSMFTWYQNGCNNSVVCKSDDYLSYIDALLNNQGVHIGVQSKSQKIKIPKVKIPKSKSQKIKIPKNKNLKKIKIPKNQNPKSLRFWDFNMDSGFGF